MTLSPLTDIPIDCNVGGYFGPLLKFSGFDALEIQGKAETDVIVVIDGQKGDDHASRRRPRRTPTATSPPRSSRTSTPTTRRTSSTSRWSRPGTGAEHSRIGCLNFSWYDRSAARRG